MKELMIHVELTVRPLHASPQRKDRMREELLAHLSEIYEEEKKGHGEGPEALARAKERFGDPGELRREIQSSIPWFERWSFSQRKTWLDRFLGRKSGESYFRYSLRLLLPVWIAIPLLVCVNQSLRGLDLDEPFLASLAVLVLVIYSLGVLGYPPIFRALEQACIERSPRRAFSWGLMASMLTILFCLVYRLWASRYAGMSFWGEVEGEELHPILSLLSWPFLAALLASKAYPDRSRRKEWESLDLNAQ